MPTSKLRQVLAYARTVAPGPAQKFIAAVDAAATYVELVDHTPLPDPSTVEGALDKLRASLKALESL